MKANFNFEPLVENPTTGIKSYQYKGRMSDLKLPTVRTFFGVRCYTECENCFESQKGSSIEINCIVFSIPWLRLNLVSWLHTLNSPIPVPSVYLECTFQGLKAESFTGWQFSVLTTSYRLLFSEANCMFKLY